MSSITQILFFLLTILSFSLFISPSLSTVNIATQSESNPKHTAYVKSACSSSTYPDLCRKTCLPLASKIAGDDRKLAKAALSATLKTAKSATSTVSKLKKQKNLSKYDANVVRDCIENMGDTLDDVKQSIDEMSDLGASTNSNDLNFKMSNVKTWMSAAITNENTCMDETKEGKVNPIVAKKIRSCIMDVVKLTSNALSLCNRLQY